jgi:hypothetical protein
VAMSGWWAHHRRKIKNQSSKSKRQSSSSSRYPSLEVLGSIDPSLGILTKGEKDDLIGVPSMGWHGDLTYEVSGWSLAL